MVSLGRTRVSRAEMNKHPEHLILFPVFVLVCLFLFRIRRPCAFPENLVGESRQ